MRACSASCLLACPQTHTHTEATTTTAEAGAGAEAEASAWMTTNETSHFSRRRQLNRLGDERVIRVSMLSGGCS